MASSGRGIHLSCQDSGTVGKSSGQSSGSVPSFELIPSASVLPAVAVVSYFEPFLDSESQIAGTEELLWINK